MKLSKRSHSSDSMDERLEHKRVSIKLENGEEVIIERNIHFNFRKKVIRFLFLKI
jgi:hypothetical protein